MVVIDKIEGRFALSEDFLQLDFGIRFYKYFSTAKNVTSPNKLDANNGFDF